MRYSIACLIVLGVVLLGCAQGTPVQQAATLACVEDETGTVLATVAADTSGTTTGTTTQVVVAGVSGVLVTAAADPNCATAIQAAAAAAAAKAQ